MLILLSPAKTLNFDAKLSPVLAAISSTTPNMGPQASELVHALKQLSRPQLKALMGLSDSLAALNHGRFATFEAQPERIAIGAFEGAAYKGLDAPTLDASQLETLQGSLRILCGLYGVLRPYDAIRPYRLEMSTKLATAEHGSLYSFWGDGLTAAFNEELDSTPESPSKFVLNVASQEYAKSVDLAKLRARVVTAQFPGPAVYAKTARGEMARFCAVTKVCCPEDLRTFTGTNGEWRFMPAQSSDSVFVFQRGPAGKPRSVGQSKVASQSPGATPSATSQLVAPVVADSAGPKKRRATKATVLAQPAPTRARRARNGNGAEEEPAPKSSRRNRP